MLSRHTITSAADAKSYYAASDYYQGGESQETVGHWFGKLADQLGLKGRVTKEAFDLLCDNLHPSGNGESLTPRTDGDRKIGEDITLSGPKSFSIIEAMAPPEERKRLLAAFDEAAMETVALDIEPDMQTRLRKGGMDADLTTGNVLGAYFDHSTARPEGGKPPDPHRHRHLIFFNATHNQQEGRIKAAQFGVIVRDRSYYEAAFYARLAHKLEALGYAIDRRDDKEWEIAGVPQSVIDTFSKRTERIEAEARKRGITDPGEKSELATKTRSKKQKALTPDELRKAWDEQLTDDERSALAQVYARAVAPGEQVTAAQAVAYALHHCFERESCLPERELKQVALYYGLGSVTPEEIAAELPRQGVLTGEKDGRRMATTRKTHAEERFITSFAAGGRGTVKPVGLPAGLERGMLDDEQWATVTGLLASHDRINLVDAAAGVGKTTALGVYDQGMKMAGRHVTYLGTTTKAVGVLGKEGFAAETVARFLRSDKLQSAAAGGTVVVDEASLLGHADAYKLFAIARNKGITLTFLGDSHQHGSVGAGSFMRLLREYGGITPFTICTIKRQENVEHREAIGLMFEGKTLDGFDRLDQLGWVREIASDAERYQAMAEEYVQARKDGEAWDQILLLSPTHAEGKLVVDAVRQKLREAGLLGAKEREFTRWVSADLTEAQRGEERYFRPGRIDMIQYHQNAKGHKNGERIEVEGLAPERLPLDQADKFQAYRRETIRFAKGDILRFTDNGVTLDGHRIRNGSAYRVEGFTAKGIRLENGWLVGKDFGHFKHGIETSPGSQGVTVGRAIIGQSSHSFGAGSMEQAYVSASRARKQVTFYTDDKASLKDAIRRSSLKLVASDIVRPQPEATLQRSWRKRLSYWHRLASLAREHAAAWHFPSPKPHSIEPERQASYGR